MAKLYDVTRVWKGIQARNATEAIERTTNWEHMEVHAREQWTNDGDPFGPPPNPMPVIIVDQPKTESEVSPSTE